jgi:hypothetical protein
LVDERERHAALNCAVFHRTFSPDNVQVLARSVLLNEWQEKWDAVDKGRFAHSIITKVSLLPWFEGQREDRNFCFCCIKNNFWSLCHSVTLE